MCFRSLYFEAILCNYIQASLGSLRLSHHNYTLLVGKVGCLVNMAALLLGLMGGTFMKVYLAGVVKKKRVTSCFGLKVIIGGSLCVSGP